MMPSVVLFLGFLAQLLQTPGPGARYELALRLRYADGRPAAGVLVSLLKLPDRTPVGWANTASACQTDAQGRCAWRLFGGLYEFAFEAGWGPDPLTLAELGEGGLNNLSVFLDRDYAMGLVLADPLTEAAGPTLFFDRAPEAPLPRLEIPGPADARQHQLAPTVTGQAVLVDLAPVGPDDAAAAPVSPVGPEEGSPRMSSWPLLLAGLGLLVGVGALLYREWVRERVKGTARQAEERGRDEAGPWA